MYTTSSSRAVAAKTWCRASRICQGLPRNPSTIADVFSGEFRNVAFWLPGAHGPVCNGMSGYDCDLRRSLYARLLQGQRRGLSQFPVHRGASTKGVATRGFAVRQSASGYKYYSHGGGDGSDGQNEVCHADGGWSDDGAAIAVGGITSQGYWIRDERGRSIDSLGSTQYPETTYENCEVRHARRRHQFDWQRALRPCRSTYPPANAGGVRLINSLVIAMGTSLTLPKTLATLTAKSNRVSIPTASAVRFGPRIAASCPRPT